MTKKEIFQNNPEIQNAEINASLSNFKESMTRHGIHIEKSVFTTQEVQNFSEKMDRIWDIQLDRYGEDYLKKINEYGTVRCMMDYENIFLDLIQDERIFKYVSAAIGNTSILHLQNGIILFPEISHHQSNYHQDFAKNFIPDTALSLNSLVVIDRFDKESGGTFFIPGSHQFTEKPSQEFIIKNEVQVHANPGDVIFFDSMLWHKGGKNISNKPRRAINHQYTKPFIKQQISYPDLLKDKVGIETKLAQILGMWTIPPKTLDEFRVDNPSKRTYRGGQG